MWIYVLLAILVFLVLFVISVYNTLVQLRNRKDDQWSQVDVQLKRRADLLPNLVETVKGYAGHEKDTLEAVIKARNTFVTATTPEEEMKASGEITQALTKLFALSEAYPELQANNNFMSLQADLKDTENKISVARQFFNDTVLTYNNKVDMFPSNLVASIFNFKRAAFFEINDADREVPQVKF